MDDRKFYEQSVRITRFFEECEKIVHIPTSVEQELFYKFKKQEIKIHDVAEKYMWLVAQYAQYYFLKNSLEVDIDAEGLIHAGTTGLMQAIPHYDPAKGLEEQYTFTSYATWWIKRSIDQYLRLS